MNLRLLAIDRITGIPARGQMLPNPAFERTAASALRLLAVPFSLRSSAAAQRER
jgi:hypothetical protein